MSTEMILALERGEWPDTARLRGWFRMALTKKLAIISLPPAYWEDDPKRNPDVLNLLWAAILLDDREGFGLVKTILATENNERPRPQPVEKQIRASCDNLLRRLSDPKHRRTIQTTLQSLPLITHPS